MVGRIVFLASDVLVSFAQQLQSLVQAAWAIRRVVHFHVVVDVFAIPDGSLLRLADRQVDLGNGGVFLAADRGISRTVLEHPAGGAQVGSRP
jgi:hypothetical protein